MTPELAKKLLPIITAFANGETIQLQTDSGKWVTFSDYSWSDKCHYRVKPKVPEYRLFMYNDGVVTLCTRNTTFMGENLGAATKQAFVAQQQGRWLTDWLPIPNYNE